MAVEKNFSSAAHRASPLILLKDVRKSYNVGLPSEVEVLHGVDVCIQPGEFVALVGPSGSGKSTLLNVLGLLEPMSSGSYQLQGQETHQLKDQGLTLLRRDKLGFVFQFHHLLPAFTALENVTLPILMAQGRVSASDQAQAVQLLEAVGLKKSLHKKPSELSGGMQQRVAIARALVRRPPLVLADEPTGNLDTQTSQEVFSVLRDIHASQGTAFLIVTHDVRLAQQCDRLVEMVDGRIALDTCAPN